MSASKLTDEEMKSMMENGGPKPMSIDAPDTYTAPIADTPDGITPLTVRKLMIIGCGDGGCNIATAIARKIPDESFVIAYNTSKRNVNDIVCDIKVYVTADEANNIVDGAGKSRDYSKDAFKLNAYKDLLSAVNVGLEKMPDISYIVVCSTADGGTGSGSSPMIAKLLSDNTDVPVLIMGVYPSMTEDAIAQYNAMQWQTEVQKIGVPYFILDNNKPGMMKHQIHRAVNEQAASIASLLAGKEFGNSTISIIDNRNLYRLLVEVGGRLTAAIENTRPTAGQTLDQHALAMLSRNYQPSPRNIRGIGVFIRGPHDMLNRMDTSLPELQKQYGNVILHFAHIEDAEDVKVAILITGNGEAADRILEMKARYDDVMSAQREEESVLAGMTSGMKNPLASGSRGISKRTPKAEIDVSALDL